MITAIALTCVGAAGYMIWDVYKGDGRKLRTLWRAGGLYNRDGDLPELKEKKRTKYGYCLRFSLPPGLSTEDFEKRQEAIEQFLNHPVRIKYKSKNMLIEVYEHDLDTFDFEPMKLPGLHLAVGYTYGKRLVTADLNQEPHLMIAGETGSGKSTALRSILTNLFLQNSRVVKHLIDLKHGAEFSIFAKCQGLASFARDVDQAAVILAAIYKEVERRYELFAEKDVVDIGEYNSNFTPLPYHVVAIDEFSLLREHKTAGILMEDLAATARACGVHLIVSTQRPDREVINGRIKANIPIVLGLKTINDLNSRIIIDESGLEKLRGRGHGWLKYKGEIVELQTMNLQPQQARDLLKPIYQEANEQKPEDTSGQVADFSWME